MRPVDQRGRDRVARSLGGARLAQDLHEGCVGVGRGGEGAWVLGRGDGFEEGGEDAVGEGFGGGGDEGGEVVEEGGWEAEGGGHCQLGS